MVGYFFLAEHWLLGQLKFNLAAVKPPLIACQAPQNWYLSGDWILLRPYNMTFHYKVNGLYN